MIVYVRAVSAKVLVGPDSAEWDPEVGYKYSLATFEVLHVDPARNNKLIEIADFKVDGKLSLSVFLQYIEKNDETLKYIDTLERPTDDVIGGLIMQYAVE